MYNILSFFTAMEKSICGMESHKIWFAIFKPTARKNLAAKVGHCWKVSRVKFSFNYEIFGQTKLHSTLLGPGQTIKHCWSNNWNLLVQQMFECLVTSKNIAHPTFRNNEAIANAHGRTPCCLEMLLGDEM